MTDAVTATAMSGWCDVSRLASAGGLRWRWPGPAALRQAFAAPRQGHAVPRRGSGASLEDALIFLEVSACLEGVISLVDLVELRVEGGTSSARSCTATAACRSARGPRRRGARREMAGLVLEVSWRPLAIAFSWMAHLRSEAPSTARRCEVPAALARGHN